MHKKNLAIFDFDNTITTKDTLLDFLKYDTSPVKFLLASINCLHVILLNRIKILSSQKAKEHIFRQFFGGKPEKELIDSGKKYSKKRLLEILNPAAISRINFHLREHDELMVISASPSYWYRDWCQTVGIGKILSTILETSGEILTGKISGTNCTGEEKLNRLLKEVNPEEYDYIYAYGDSKGDLQMLNFANESYLNFKRIK